VKVLHSVFFGPQGEASRQAAETPGRENVAIVLPMVVLAAACVLLGVWPQGFLDGALVPAVGSAAPGEVPKITGMNAMAGPLGLWSPTKATGLLVLAFVLGGVLLLLGKARKFRVGRTFLCGEVREDDPELRISGTEFYRTIGDLPLVGPMLRDGAAEAYDPYRLIGQGGGALVQVLRRVHTGVLPLYVTWVLAGLLTILLIVLQAG